MPLNSVSLGHGAEGIFAKNNHFNTTGISFNFYLPLNRETIAENALLPFVLTTCGKKYPDFSRLNFSLAKLYGASLTASSEKCGDYQLLKMGISFINDAFALDDEKIASMSADLLMSLIFEPKAENGKFSADDVEREKRKAAECIKGEMADKKTYANSRLIAEMFENEPYGAAKCGTVEQVEAISVSNLFKAWGNMVSTAPLRVCVVGEQVPEGLFELIKQNLAKINRENVIALPASAPLKKRDEVKTITEKMDIAQGKLCIGFSSDYSGFGKNMAALSVAADVFGGGPYSLLFTNVREKMSLCYYCACGANKRKSYLSVSSGVEPQNIEKAEKEILNQLETLKNGEIPDELVANSVRSICDSLAAMNDSATALDTFYSINKENPEILTPEDLISQYSSVTKEDVIKAANSLHLNTVYKLVPGKEEKNEKILL